MELSLYVNALHAHLATAAAAGGDEAAELAERLTAPLDAAARLVLQDAVSDAAQEITRELAPGSVELRLRGRELTFVVNPPPPVGPADDGPSAGDLDTQVPEPSGEGGTARITFRPPDLLKARIEAAAEREGLSVNTFLVRTLTAALDPARSTRRVAESTGSARVEGWFR